MKITHQLFFALLLSFSRLFAQELALSSPAAQDTAEQPVAGVPAEPANPKLLTNFIEAGGSLATLTNAFGSFSGGYARGVASEGRHILFAEINGQREFKDAGVYFAVGDTYNFNDDWYGSVVVGSSAGGFFWPRFRSDGFINKKWLGRKQWITTAGYGYYKAKDIHYDQSFFLGTTYYFSKPWIVEEGIRFNLSNPGNVFSPSTFVAVTQGNNKQRYVTVRVGFGEEAYQLVGPTASLTDFNSQTYTVTWRQWVGKNWGFNAIADFYHSPFYFRSGGILGLFKEF
jgi:YaiO family outer membrane protein